MSDDIYITFRTLYNFNHGYGMVWNTPERVQTFTHPLWLMCLAPIYAVVEHAYFTAIGLSLAIAVAIPFALRRFCQNDWLAGGGILLLLSSRAFVDFSTSGLENPLSHLLLLLFAGEIGLRSESKPRFLRLGLWAALLLMTRLDMLLFILPALAFLTWKHRSKSTAVALLKGVLPFICWEIFSIVYYGFPFPNTFYAKAMTGFPKAWLLEQGGLYLWDSLTSDYLTLPAILLTAVLVFWKGNVRQKVLFTGVVLYLAYVVWVGGDFMSGRFFTAPLLVSVILLLTLDWAWKWRLGWTMGLMAVALFQPYHPVYTGKNYYADRQGRERELYGWSGVVDEKGMAWQRSALWHLHGGMPVLQVEKDMASWGEDPGKILQVKTAVAVGLEGYRSGPNVFLIDELALTDPLLARLPALRVPYWRIGHFFRRLPAGFIEGIENPEIGLADEDLNTYQLKLEKVTQGDIWSGERWGEILRFNLGLNTQLINKEVFQTPSEAERTRFD